MNSCHFHIFPLSSQNPQDCIIHFEDGYYHVFVEGNLLEKWLGI